MKIKMEIRVNQTIPIERKWVTYAHLKHEKGCESNRSR